MRFCFVYILFYEQHQTLKGVDTLRFCFKSTFLVTSQSSVAPCHGKAGERAGNFAVCMRFCFCFKDQNVLWLNELPGAFDPALIMTFYPSGVQEENSASGLKNLFEFGMRGLGILCILGNPITFLCLDSPSCLTGQALHRGSDCSWTWTKSAESWSEGWGRENGGRGQALGVVVRNKQYFFRLWVCLFLFYLSE